MIIAIDFDGTLVENEWPKIGKPKWQMINKVKELQQKGHIFILWSCREGKELKEAEVFLDSVGLHFEYINCNPTYRIEQFNGNDCRKIGADYYVDDKALSLQDFINL